MSELEFPKFFLSFSSCIRWVSSDAYFGTKIFFFVFVSSDDRFQVLQISLISIELNIRLML